ncbi:MAG TPA: xanthine dehydrogenase molybdopterin binding subunit [Sandaracinaceae bacterium LLY-WYZ-13_1]|nr:xanthine dehydrogenase molybdopterin binding subunit [Sandaracinaceae bacterium LLY-WYZ-13_1]
MSVGKAISHESAEGHVTGAALYTDDLVPRYPRCLHAWPVQVMEARATVKAVHLDDALALPGVVTVLTADDVIGENDTGAARRDEPLFPTEIVYWGQPVCWILAETEEAAKMASLAVRIDVEKKDAILSIEDALAAESFHTEPGVIARGDVDAAIEGASHVLEGELFVGGQEHFYLETQAAIADVDEAGSVLVQSSTQHPSETQEIVARVLDVPKNRVVVQSLRMGGAFGGKEVQANAWAAVAALGVRKTGRPVRVRLDRMRDFQLTGKRHPFLGRYRVGFDGDGKLRGFDVEMYSDGGWSLDLSAPVLHRALFHADNAYHLPNTRVVGRVCRTNHVSHTAFRGFGGPQGMLMIEDALDRMARTLSLPPHVVRERNLYREGDTTHYEQPVSQAERVGRIWEDLSAHADFEARWEAMEAFNAAHPNRKRGLAITPVKFGISFTAKHFNQAGALVLVYRDGSVQVNHGGTEMGQGLHTKMLQVAAHALGVPFERVRMMPTRTDKVPNTSATAASSGSDLNGAAIRNACETIKGRLASVAAVMLDTHPEEIVFEDGMVRRVDLRGEALPFGDVVERAYMERVQLSSTGYYRTPRIHFDAKTGRGKPFHYFAYGAAITEVEVDGFTGMYAIRRVDILHDVGDSLSPLVDLGQVEGGFMQGLGWLTQEQLWWAPDGRLGTANASTYKLPTIGELPEEVHVRLLPKATEPGVVYGSKAVGEPPFMLAISAREALRQAVAAFARPGAVVTMDSPATAEEVFFAVERARASAEASAPVEEATAGAAE